MTKKNDNKHFFYPEHFDSKKLEDIFHFTTTKRREFIKKIQPKSKDWATKFESNFYQNLWEFLGNPVRWPLYNSIASSVQSKRYPLTIHKAICKSIWDFDQQQLNEEPDSENNETVSDLMEGGQKTINVAGKLLEIDRPQHAVELIWSSLGHPVTNSEDLNKHRQEVESLANENTEFQVLVEPLLLYIDQHAKSHQKHSAPTLEEQWASAVKELRLLVDTLEADVHDLEIAKTIKAQCKILSKTAKRLQAERKPDLKVLKSQLDRLIEIVNGDWQLASASALTESIQAGFNPDLIEELEKLSHTVSESLDKYTELTDQVASVNQKLAKHSRTDRNLARQLADKSDELWEEGGKIQDRISAFFKNHELDLHEPEAKSDSGADVSAPSIDSSTNPSQGENENPTYELEEKTDLSGVTSLAESAETELNGTAENSQEMAEKDQRPKQKSRSNQPGKQCTIPDNQRTSEPKIDEKIPLECQEESLESETQRLNLKQTILTGNFSLAYWICSARKAAGHEIPVEPMFLGAIAESIFETVDGAIGSRLREFISEISKITHYDKNEQILTATAMICTSMLAGTDAQSDSHFQNLANKNLKCNIVELNDLTKFVVDNIIRRGWSPSRLASPDPKGSIPFEVRLADLGREASEYLGNVSQIRFSYQPAHSAYLEIFSPESKFHELLSIIANKTTSERKLARVDSILSQFDPNDIVNNLRDITSYKGQLQGSTRSQFANKLSKALDIASRWRGLVHKSTFVADIRDADQLELKLDTLVRKAIKAMQTHKNNSAVTEAICRGLSILLDRTTSILAGELIEFDPTINQALIRFPSIQLDNSYEPLPGELIKLLEYTIDEEVDQSVSDTETIETLIDRLEYRRAFEISNNIKDVEKWKKEIEKRKTEKIRDLKKQSEQVENDIEEVNLLGLLTEDFREPDVQDARKGEKSEFNEESVQSKLTILTKAELQTQLADAEKILEHAEHDATIDIRDADEILSSVTRFVREKKRKRQKDLSQQIESQIPLLQHSDTNDSDADYVKAVLNSLLQVDDNVALAELRERVDKAVRENTPVDRIASTNVPAADLFLKEYEFLEDLRKRNDLKKAIIQGTNIGCLNFANRDKAHRNRALNAVDAWSILNKKTSFVSSDKELIAACKSILNLVGISDVNKLKFGKSPGQNIVQFDSPTDGYLASPIPAFGSELKGSLRIVLFGEKQQPRKLIQTIKKAHASKAGVLAIHVNPLSVRQRLDIRDLCFREKTTCVVIDFATLAYLCGARDPLVTFFDIVLPLTWSQPYLMAGENVPKEMFVGRSNQINDLMNQTGSCIVFGGRQLGKSALLRHIANQYHSPENDIFIAYKDIDDLGSSPQTNSDMEQDLWFRISQEIHHVGFMTQQEQKSLAGMKVTKRNAPKVVPDLIRSRLEKHENDRLILLLDEVDDMLDMDLAEDFRIVTNFRGLMSDTDRRFKVIFTGLKSVQRFQNYENQPFTQLGSVLVVRPLLPRPAEDLVRRPLRALGYVFESPALLLRIFAQSNYHPGLIQIFCYRLLENLNQLRDKNKAIRTITRHDVNRVERDRDFIEDVRNRFDWTLDLDERYKVLTYALIMSESASLQLSVQQFKKIGRYWWPKVFETIEPQAMRGLLDEMEGLGVLLKIVEKNQVFYRLRSPNLLRLLGSKDDVESEMLKITEKNSPTKLNPKNYHKLLDAKRGLFGVMTREQESLVADTSALFQTSLIYGSCAVGIHQVDDHIRHVMQSLGHQYGHEWKELKLPSSVITAGEHKLSSYLRDKMKPHKRPHLFTICNLNELPSDVNRASLVKALMESPGRVCKTLSQGRVFLISDEASSWNLINDRNFQEFAENEAGLVEIVLRRWSDGAIAHALDDVGLKTRARDNGKYIFAKSQGLHTIVQSSLQSFRSGVKSLKKEAISKAVASAVEEAADANSRQGFEIANLELKKLLYEILELGAKEGEERLPWDETISLIEDSYPDLLADHGRVVRKWIQVIGLAGPMYMDGDMSLVTFSKSLIH